MVSLRLVTAVHEHIVFATVTMEIDIDTHLEGERGERRERAGRKRGREGRKEGGRAYLPLLHERDYHLLGVEDGRKQVLQRRHWHWHMQRLPLSLPHLQWLLVHPVEVHAGQGGPVVPHHNPVRIQHGNHLEHEV